MFLSRTKIGSSFVLGLGLVFGSLQSLGQPAQDQTLLLKEGASITVIKTSSGDLTAREDSYLKAFSHAFSQENECSRVRLEDSGKTNFMVEFFVAHLLEQYTVSYAVVDKSGSVINTGTTNSFADTAEKICELIKVSSKEPRHPKCSPGGKGKRRDCDVDEADGKRASKGISYY